MFSPDVPETLTCGCTLTLRRSETVELVFLEPCTLDHQRAAERLRGNALRSKIVVKAVQ